MPNGKREGRRRARRAILLLSILCVGLNFTPSNGSFAQAPNKPIRIGILTDMGGPFSAYTGPGSVEAARMAAEEIGGTINGRKVEVLVADHQNKPDVGSAIARRWFDVEDVDVIADLGSTAVGLPVVQIGREKNKVVLVTSPGAPEFSGRACTPNSIHWTWDTIASARGAVASVPASGNNRWFFVTSDYSFGHSFERVATAAIAARGERVIGHVFAPLGASDFSSFLLQAQSSGANIVAFAAAGADMNELVKQAQEFGLPAAGITVLPLQLLTPDIKALGLSVAQGMQLIQPYYYYQSEEARRWSEAFLKRTGFMPSYMHIGTYTAVRHFLKAVERVGTDDGAKIVAEMKRIPILDAFNENATIRADGRMVHDVFAVRVKSPQQSEDPWDLVDVLQKIPGSGAFRAEAESECPLVRQGGSQ